MLLLASPPTESLCGHQEQEEETSTPLLVADQQALDSIYTLIKAQSPIPPHKSATQAVLNYWTVAGYIIAIFLGKGIANAAVFFVF